MGFWVGLAAGVVAGTIGGAAAISARMGLWRLAIEEIRAHCDGLVEQLGEPTEEPRRKRTL